ncbi:MAG TPA: integrase core domain-containing protein [Actinomycetota bacterium]|nr:integrase core domain-containing protein [Actinomycetota bacterium]
MRTPIRAPKANAFAERWVGSARRECLDHVLIFGRRHLERVLDAYTEHYNRARPHRAIGLHPPDGASGRWLAGPSARCPGRTPPRVLQSGRVIGVVILEPNRPELEPIRRTPVSPEEGPRAASPRALSLPASPACSSS